jgi:hypothetical protein
LYFLGLIKTKLKLFSIGLLEDAMNMQLLGPPNFSLQLIGSGRVIGELHCPTDVSVSAL